MDSLKYCLLCLAALILVISIREYENRFAFFIRIAVYIGIGSACASMFSVLLTYIKNSALVLSTDSESQEIFTSMLKMTGISFLGCITSSICRDTGENGLANTLENVCKLEIILLSLPIIDYIIEKIQNIL